MHSNRDFQHWPTMMMSRPPAIRGRTTKTYRSFSSAACPVVARHCFESCSMLIRTSGKQIHLQTHTHTKAARSVVLLQFRLLSVSLAMRPLSTHFLSSFGHFRSASVTHPPLSLSSPHRTASNPLFQLPAIVQRWPMFVGTFFFFCQIKALSQFVCTFLSHLIVPLPAAHAHTHTDTQTQTDTHTHTHTPHWPPPHPGLWPHTFPFTGGQSSNIHEFATIWIQFHSSIAVSPSLSPSPPLPSLSLSLALLSFSSIGSRAIRAH